MFLEKIIVINFKSCKEISVSLKQNEPSVFIGINDCGKSTILEAIGLLLNPKPKFNFASEGNIKDDISNSKLSKERFDEICNENNIPAFDTYSENECIIIGHLVIEEGDYDDELADSFTNHFKWILENKEEGDNSLWIAREFKSSNPKPKDFIITPDREGEPLYYYNSKNTELTKKSKELLESGILTKDQIENENEAGRYKNLELVRALYLSETISTHWIEVIFKTERSIFPKYRYLDWNISMEELKQFTSDTMQDKVQNQIDLANRFARRQSDRAQEIINTELQNFTNDFASDLPNIDSIKANIFFELQTKITDFIVNKPHSDGDIHLESQGEGVKRQIWFALLKWNALNSIGAENTNKKFIWCFDEPETHLYPAAQRDFFGLIKQISQSNIQTVLSTHSTIFIDRTVFGNIKKVDIDAGYTFLASCNVVDDVFNALKLRNSDFLFYNKFLVVEGDTEATLIPNLYSLIYGSSLIQDGVQVMKIGGSGKRHQNKTILESLLRDFRKANDVIVYVFDNDVSYDREVRRAIEEGATNFFFLGSQDIEDSINSTIWQSLYNNILEPYNLEVSIEEIDRIKESIPTDRQGSNEEKFFPLLSRHIVRKITESEIEEFDFSLLPKDKGTDMADELSQLIENQNDFDANLVAAFEMLRE